MGWKKGESGNPNGRPPKEQSLTSILSMVGEESVHLAKCLEGKEDYTRKLLASYYAWQGITDFQIESLTTGKIISIDTLNDWLNLWKWVVNRVDGPPRQELDVTSGNEPLAGGGVVIILPSNGRELEDSPSTGAAD